MSRRPGLVGVLRLFTSFLEPREMDSRNGTEEVPAMAEPKNNGGVKTLGVKLTNSLHNQFSLVAQLDDLSLADAVIKAVELYVETKQAEPDFQQRAAEALEEIEREAAARRGAIQALLGQDEAGGRTRKKA